MTTYRFIEYEGSEPLPSGTWEYIEGDKALKRRITLVDRMNGFTYRAYNVESGSQVYLLSGELRFS